MAHSDNDSGNEGTSNRRRVPTREERENLPYPPDPPRYAWYRPRMQGFPARLNLYVRDIVVEQIPIVLKRVGGKELLQRFKDGPFFYLLDIKRNGTANVALHELLARELTDPSFSEFERWFHVGGRDIRFGAQEFCLVTGLFFCPSEFDPNRGDHVIPPTSLFYTRYNGQKTKDKTLLKDFINPHINMGTPDQYLSAANLLMYYYMLLCRDNQTIEPWLLHNHRTAQILPLSRLFPRLLHVAHYWEQHPSYTKRKDELQIVFLSRSNFVKTTNSHVVHLHVWLWIGYLLQTLSKIHCSS